MPVIKVIEDGTKRLIHEAVVLEMNQRPKVKMEAQRTFTVEFDNGDDPVVRPFLARTATDDTTTVPAMWASHPYGIWLFVNSKDIKIIGPFLIEVTVNYECTVDAETGLPVSPLMEPPKISFSSVGTNDPIDTDSEGLPIVNSAGESFDPPITMDHSDTVLRITRNEKTFSDTFAAEFRDAVNSDTFLGHPPGHVKCTVFTADQMRAATLVYYTVRYEFQIRYSFVKTRDSNGDIKERVFGWVRRVRDEGFRESTGDTNKDGSPEIDEIEDKNSIKVSQPHLLDGSGKKLSAAAILNPPLPEACFLKFDIYKKREFSVLNL